MTDQVEFTYGDPVGDDEPRCTCSAQSIYVTEDEQQTIPCTARAGADGLCQPCRAGCTLVNTVYTAEPDVVVRRHGVRQDP